MTNSFEKYILCEIRGKGRIIFEDFTDNTATCQIYQLNQGNLFGSLLFTKIDNKINEVMNFRRPFRFDGETTDGLKISAEQCAAFFTEIKQNGSLPVPLIISRIHTNVLKVYNPNKLENLEEGTDLCIEIGLLNYYSTATNFLINSEIGDIRMSSSHTFKSIFILLSSIILADNRLVIINGSRHCPATELISILGIVL